MLAFCPLEQVLGDGLVRLSYLGSHLWNGGSEGQAGLQDEVNTLALCLDSQGKLDLECLGSVLPLTTGSEAPVLLKAELVKTQPLPFKD